jgi:hypothetical protein
MCMCMYVHVSSWSFVVQRDARAVVTLLVAIVCRTCGELWRRFCQLLSIYCNTFSHFRQNSKTVPVVS